jgi:hypothetical protein
MQLLMDGCSPLERAPPPPCYESSLHNSTGEPKPALSPRKMSRCILLLTLLNAITSPPQTIWYPGSSFGFLPNKDHDAAIHALDGLNGTQSISDIALTKELFNSTIHDDESTTDVKSTAPLSFTLSQRSRCQETSRRDTANKRSPELYASIVLLFLDGCSEWYVPVVFLTGQVLGIWIV